MGLFKKNKPEERPKTDIHEVKKAVIEGESFSKPIPIHEFPKKEIPKPSVEKPKEKIKDKSRFAPLFIKIDRYGSVLSLLNDLKATVMMVKNAIVVQKEIERLAGENRKLIEDGVDKIDNSLIRLDAEFIRPKGFKDEFKPGGAKSGLEGVVDDLKSQLDGLKSELETIS